MASACPHNYRRRSNRITKERGPVELVVFDMDGVLIHNGSSWVLVHRHFGVQNEAGYEAYMAGQIDDHEFIRTDVALWARDGPVHDSVVDQVLSRPDFVPGAKETVEALHEAGIRTAIVSGGLDHMAKRVARHLGIDDVYANGLMTDEQGYLTGEGILRTPLCDKSEPLERLVERLQVPHANVVAIGDSCPDTSMFEAVGLGIAFNPADDCVRHAADVVVEGNDLMRVLPHIL